MLGNWIPYMEHGEVAQLLQLPGFQGCDLKSSRQQPNCKDDTEKGHGPKVNRKIRVDAIEA